MSNRKLIGAGIAVAVAVVAGATGLTFISPSNHGMTAFAQDGPTDDEMRALFIDYVREIGKRMMAIEEMGGPGIFGPCGRATLGQNASPGAVSRCQADQKAKQASEFEANLASLIVTVKDRKNLEGNYLVTVNARRRGTDDADDYKFLVHQENGHWSTLKVEPIKKSN